MSQRNSGYARHAGDLYQTPAWCTQALIRRRVWRGTHVWEPAAGPGKMVEVLRGSFETVTATDIDTGNDFLAETKMPPGCNGIITNPPYDKAVAFVEHALKLTEPVQGYVAMLLRTDFDHAQSRVHLFRDCPAFACKLVLMRRIVWFVEDDGKPRASPSYNHAWYIWDWRHEGLPTIAYGP